MSLNACPRCGALYTTAHRCDATSRLPVLVSNAPLPLNTLVGGRFRIRAVAHRSSMSTVYRAADTRHGGMAVALKEFSAAGLSSEERGEALVWLTREASLLSTLDHPRLPKLLAAFSEGDRHYLAMPFLEGETLEERVARTGPQEEGDVLRWGMELADLLVYLHGQDPPVVHRDLKPANVLLQADGTLALLDLGVARPLARQVAGTAIGTPGYAPPEQYQGLADERSDLFALGATLHRLLTGYDAEHAEPFRHPRVRDLNPAVSKPTATLVASLLQLAPGARPAGAQTVADALARAAALVEASIIQPVHRMYGQMLGVLAGTAGLAALLYMAFPAVDPATTLVLFVVAGIVCSLPLFHPGLMRSIARYPQFAYHRKTAAWVLARGYLFAFFLHSWFTVGIAVALVANWLFHRYRETAPNLPGRAPQQLAP